MTPANFDVAALRSDFPILQQCIYGKPLVYLDNGATTQKPQVVIAAVDQFYQETNANVHRGVHALSSHATDLYEGARLKVQTYLNAPSHRCIIFTRGTTDSINCIAQAFGGLILSPGDEILLSLLEHHSNIVPWQMIAESIGCQLKVIPLRSDGTLDQDAFTRLLTPQTKLLALGHISNALGVIHPIEQMISQAHACGVKVVIDGAQAMGHLRVDVQALDCDFYVFSGHKMFGPTGIGVLYGKEELLQAMPPYQGGGDMIETVSFAKTTYAGLPNKLEAGTPNIAGAIGLAAAVDYLQQLDFKALQAHESDLYHYARARLQEISGLTLHADLADKAPILSFVFDEIHAHDVGTIVDRAGVAVRVGHHCAMPLMEHLQVPATVRASCAFYNTLAEIDALISALHEVKQLFS